MLNKIKGKAIKSNGVTRKSDLGPQQQAINDVSNIIEEGGVSALASAAKPQSSLNHMIPLRGTLINGTNLGNLNSGQTHAIVNQVQGKA